jgi:hypothetical protein
VPIWDWAGLAVFLAVPLVGTVLLARKGLRTWRQLRRLQSQANVLVARLAEASAVAERRSNAATEGADRLQRHVEHMNVSVARLNLLVAELNAVLSSAKRLRSTYLVK